jgi:tetratricopeptide (TPR) repeat protein/MFS family permease
MIGALVRTKETKFVLGAYALAAIVCAFLPLADHLGFELAAALTLVAAVVAPCVGFGAMRLELQVRPEERRPARAAAIAGLVAVLGLAVPVLLILLNGLRRPLCDPVAGSVWMLILPAPTAWLAATLGAVARLLFPRLRWAIAAVATVELATIGTSLAVGYLGPVFFGFDHFAGYFYALVRSGSIPISSALLSFRAATVGWGVAAVALAGALGSGDRSARRMHVSWALGMTAALIVISAGWGSALGWRTTDRSIRKVLNGEIRADSLVIHFPQTLGDRAIETLVRDATYAADAVARSLGIRPAHPVHVWAYASGAQKSRLVGAGAVPFAKPYRREVHIVQGGFPHGSLRHELIHAMAAEFARGPWLVPGGLLANGTLIEGFAMAYDVDDESLSLTQEAKAMRDVQLEPDLERMLSPTGFGAEATSRAYTYSGAFIRYLDSRFGTAAMRRLYLTGDLSTLGASKALVADFHRMLDTVKSDANARSTAARSHARPSILVQRCPREISAIEDSAYVLAANRQWDRSLAMFDKACALQPENPDLRRQKLGVAIRMRPNDVALPLVIAESLWRHPRLDPGLEAESRVQMGDELLRRGDVAAATVHYRRAASLPADPGTRRAITVRLLALADSSLGPLLRPLFVDPAAVFAVMVGMSDALAKRPDQPLVLYLLGRQYQQRGAPDKGAELMERADAIGLGDPDLTRENLRTLVVARTERQRCDEAERALGRLRAAGGSANDIAVAADLVARCRFAVARGWKPL